MLFEFDAGLSTASVVFQVVQICVTSLLGIFGVAAALNGYLFRPLNPLFRIAIAVGGLCMMVPEPISDVVGLVIVAGLYLFLRATSKKAAVA